MRGEGSLLLLGDAGARLSGSSGTRRSAVGSDEDESYKELKLELESGSSSITAHRAKGALILVRRGDWWHAASALEALVVVLFTILAAGPAAAYLRVHCSRSGSGGCGPAASYSLGSATSPSFSSL